MNLVEIFLNSEEPPSLLRNFDDHKLFPVMILSWELEVQKWQLEVFPEHKEPYNN